MKNTVVVISLLVVMVGCKKEEKPVSQTPYSGLQVPAHFPPPVYTFANNTPTNAAFELGRKLFYDPLLSVNNTVSCGTCHAQVHAFADHAANVSTGVFGRSGLRNSPPLANLAWFPSFMWDGGINHIETIPIAPITDSNEMGETLANVVQKLNADKTYPGLFQQAFGAPPNSAYMLKALAQFMAAMVSANSKYDRYVNGQATLTEAEAKGLVLFKQHCNSCHTEPLFTDFSFRNNGIGATQGDSGRARITQNMADVGKFRVPSLRNVELTNPYMHNGSIFTLDEVVEHYTSHKSGATVDASLRNGMPLSDDDKQNLVKFLKTLTDYSYIANSKFAEP